jgi:hypothetical protein
VGGETPPHLVLPQAHGPQRIGEPNAAGAAIRRGTIRAMSELAGHDRSERGASPAQIILALLVLGLAALVAVLAVRRVGL